MNILTRCPKSVLLLLLFVFAILLPQSVAAQPTLSVVPTSVSVQTNVSTNAPSQTVQVRKTGAGTLRWTVEPPAAAWVTVSPTSGTNNVTLTLTFQTSGLAAQTQPYTTSFRVVSGTQSVTVNVAVTIVGSTPPPPPPTLSITCPANMSVASPDGSPVVVTYTVTTSGGNPPVTLIVTPPSGSSFSVGTATVQANAQSQDGQKKSCSFTVTVTFSSPSSDWTFCASEGGFCTFVGTQQVRYGANGSYFFKTLSDGTACTNSVFGDPISGVVKQCAIPASASIDQWTFCAMENQTCAFTGTREVRYGANGSYAYLTLSNGTPCTNGVFGDPISGIVKQCYIKATAPPSSSFGARPTITCPNGAVDVWPGASIQLLVDANVGGTSFCLHAGTHPIAASIKPKTGDTFVGEYGAILDGTGWTTTDDTQAAFRAYNEDIDYVTIRNLVIRNMPEYGIHASYALNALSDHWTIEYNEIASNKYGLLFGPDFIIRNNYIHDNVGTPGSTAQRGGGYMGLYATNTLFDSNEIAWNGPEQKVFAAANMTFRNNFVHHNLGDGIWYDSDNTGALVEGNRVEDNGRNGIFYEASIGITIRNNTLRRNNAGDAVLISMSQNAQIYNNSLEANFGGIQYFLNCASLSSGEDVKNNAAYDNTIVVGTQSNTYANGFSYSFALCTSAQAAPYLNGSKNLTFSRNAYRVPSLSNTKYFIWPSYTDWNAWQALGQDVGGSLSQ